MSDPGPGRRPVLPPVAYPLLGLVFGAILVFSFSRILLAVSKDYAPAIALLMALCILVGAAVVAYGGRVRRRPASFPLLLVGAAAVVVVGVAAMNLPQETAEGEGGGAPPVKVALVAQNVAFNQTELRFPAGAKVEIDFDNKDAGVPHNVALFSDEAKTQVVFRGDLITGPAATVYSFDAPTTPGTYYFHCDVHPTQMDGTVVIGPAGAGGGGEGGPGAGGGEGGGPEPGGGGGGPEATLTAQGTAFQPTALTVKGGGQITIHFDNKDAGIPHNLAVFDGEDASAPVVFRGDLVTGPQATDYAFTAPPPGSYFFHCDVHPTQMSGTLTVT